MSEFIVNSWVYPGRNYTDDEGVYHKESGKGAKWFVKITTTKTSTPGITKVDWSLHKDGREGKGSPSWIYTHGYLDITSANTMSPATISYNSGLLKSGTGTPSCSFANPKEVVTSGSFNISHGTDGKASFDVKLNVAIYYYTTFHELTTTVTLEGDDINYPYTDCSKPTSVAANATNGYVKPGGFVNVSWRGATGGIQNNIARYAIYYRITQAGAKPSEVTYTGKVTADAAATSCNVTIPSTATRGYKIVFGVVAEGEQGHDYDSEITYSGEIKVNYLPSPPSVSVDGSNVTEKILPSTRQNDVHFSVTSGSDNDGESQTLTVHYATSSTGTKQKITNGTLDSAVPAKNAQKTLYFYTYDGLEYSAARAVTIKRNPTPTIDIIDNGPRLISTNSAGDADYVVAPAFQITMNETFGDSNELTYEISYRQVSQTDYSTMVGSAVILANGNFIIPDVRFALQEEGVDLFEDGCYYKIKFTRDDGVESVVKETSEYYVTEIPKILKIINNHSDIPIDTSSLGEGKFFDDKIRIIIDRDEGFDNYSLFFLSGQATMVGKYFNDDETRLDFTFQGNNGRGDSDRFDLGLSYNTGYSTAILPEEEYSRIEKMSFSITSTNNKMTPFTNDSLTLNFNNLNFSLGLEDFYIYGMDAQCPILYGIIGGGEVEGVIEDLSIQSSSVNDVSIWFKNLFGLLPASLDKNKSSEIKFYFRAQNKFGTTVYAETTAIADFRETPTLKTYGLNVYGQNIYADDFKYLKEGMELRLDLQIESYNTDVWAQLLINRNDGKGFVTFVENIQESLFYLTKESSPEQPLPGQPCVYTVNGQLIKEIPEIRQEDYNVQFALLFSSAAGQSKQVTLSYEGKNTVKAKRHVPGVVNVSSMRYTKFGATTSEGYTGRVDFNYVFGDPGIIDDDYTTLTITMTSRNVSLPDVPDNWIPNKDPYVYINNLAMNGTSDISWASNETEGYRDFELKTDAVFVRLEVTIKNTFLVETTKTAYCTAYLIYNMLPTIAYRKNHVGINRTDFTNFDDAVMLIGEHEGRDKVYFASAARTTFIDLNLGTLNNFIIRGGTWDGSDNNDTIVGYTYAEDLSF